METGEKGKKEVKKVDSNPNYTNWLNEFYFSVMEIERSPFAKIAQKEFKKHQKMFENP